MMKLVSKLRHDKATSAQLRNNLRQAVTGQHRDLSTVPILLRPGRPLEIARRVVTVIIDPVERVFRRGARPDLGKKFLEGRKTKGDATATVVLEARGFAIATSLLGGLVGRIFRRMLALLSLSVRSVGGKDSLSMKTAARATSSAKKLIGPDTAKPTASTHAEPKRSIAPALTLMTEVVNNKPPLEAKAEKIAGAGTRKSLGNWFKINNGGHVDLLNRFTMCGGSSNLPSYSPLF